MFTSDPRVNKVTFTGSTAVGRTLAAAAGASLKRISVELGGHAPFLVMPDADPVHAAKGAVMNLSSRKIREAGQWPPNGDEKNDLMGTRFDRQRKCEVSAREESRGGAAVRFSDLLF